MKEQMTVEMLRYQIAKYRVMGNGAMCQELTALLQKKIGSCGCLILEESTSRDK